MSLPMSLWLIITLGTNKNARKNELLQQVAYSITETGPGVWPGLFGLRSAAPPAFPPRLPLTPTPEYKVPLKICRCQLRTLIWQSLGGVGAQIWQEWTFKMFGDVSIKPRAKKSGVLRC